jgi:alkanesulfonate monooxygenase SsuD/methylene tetrahydromethanopterin reductase-like flavin-dependent oxidoreductase (luciferase family)
VTRDPDLSPRPSLFFDLRATGSPEDVYATALGHIEQLESLGFGAAWVAVRHFGSLSAALPSAFPFLAVAASRTRRIRLGSAVLPLIFEDVIGIAEDAAVTNLLGGDRLELGVGKALGFGASAASFEVFGIEQDRIGPEYGRQLDGLRQALDGRVARAPEVGVYPVDRRLSDRIWQATASESTVREAAAAGDGILLHRDAGRGSIPVAQAGLIGLYRALLPPGTRGRIGLSRTVIPGASRQQVREALAEDARARPYAYPELTGGDGLDELLAGVAYGSSEQIVETLRADAAVRGATDILFTIPTSIHYPGISESYRQIAEEIYPALLGARGDTP